MERNRYDPICIKLFEVCLSDGSSLSALCKGEVEGADDGVGIVDGDGTDIGEGLDLGGALLDLVVGHLEAELADTRLDGVPASQPRGEVDVAGKTEVGGVENLVGAGVVEDGLGVDTGLVGEGAEAGDGVVEGGVDLDGLGDKILDLLDHLEVVLALDVLGSGDDHAGHQTTEGRNAVALTDTENGGVDVGGTGLEGAVGVGDGAASVIVEVGLDVARNDTTERPDEVIDLAGRSAADGISNTDTVDTNLVNGAVERKKVDEVGAERILRRDCWLLAILCFGDQRAQVCVLQVQKRGVNKSADSRSCATCSFHPDPFTLPSDAQRNPYYRPMSQLGKQNCCNAIGWASNRGRIEYRQHVLCRLAKLLCLGVGNSRWSSQSVMEKWRRKWW